jgi:hypothetical protein
MSYVSCIFRINRKSSEKSDDLILIRGRLNLRNKPEAGKRQDAAWLLLKINSMAYPGGMDRYFVDPEKNIQFKICWVSYLFGNGGIAMPRDGLHKCRVAVLASSVND